MKWLVSKIQAHTERSKLLVHYAMMARDPTTRAKLFADAKRKPLWLRVLEWGAKPVVSMYSTNEARAAQLHRQAARIAQLEKDRIYLLELVERIADAAGIPGMEVTNHDGIVDKVQDLADAATEAEVDPSEDLAL